MIRETQHSGGRSEEFPPAGVSRNIFRFAHDLWELGELQFQLAKHDAKAATSRIAIALGLLGVGLVIAASVIPVLFVAAAWVLIHRADLPHEAAYAIVAVAAVLLAAVLGLIAWGILRKALAVFHRSSEEFSENVRWIKQSLKTHA